jgi:hypothetical protein
MKLSAVTVDLKHSLVVFVEHRILYSATSPSSNGFVEQLQRPTVCYVS